MGIQTLALRERQMCLVDLMRLHHHYVFCAAKLLRAAPRWGSAQISTTIYFLRAAGEGAGAIKTGEGGENGNRRKEEGRTKMISSFFFFFTYFAVRCTVDFLERWGCACCLLQCVLVCGSDCARLATFNDELSLCGGFCLCNPPLFFLRVLPVYVCVYLYVCLGDIKLSLRWRTVLEIRARSHRAPT